MTPLDLLRAARDLESAGLDREADRLRWAASRAVSGSVLPAHTLSGPAPPGDDLDELAPSCLLSAALRDAESAGDLAACDRLLGALAGLERPPARAA